MKVDIRELGKVTVVAVTGEVDLQTSPKLREALIESLKANTALVVDLGAVDYIDSSGITSLLEALKLAKEKKVSFTLAKVSPGAMRVIQLGRLDKVFTIVDSVDATLGES
ncbi:MAG: STAS domain-containing protein [Rhodospirillum sp.]|nr:STAS domain-containing protein [Rhodospirillum sp.]MCF8488666.1 STAS domain-containing protein [Rhodospirillum sp.]MCF8503195.1 STAS domain-containing protein [Rhodospirillum sp.]